MVNNKRKYMKKWFIPFIGILGLFQYSCIGDRFKVYSNSSSFSMSEDIPKLRAKSDLETALRSLRWVKKHIKYTSDESLYMEEDYWASPEETLRYRMGDCEDGAILLKEMMIKNGIGRNRIELTIKGNHAFITYFDKNNEPYKLDWTDK